MGPVASSEVSRWTVRPIAFRQSDTLPWSCAAFQSPEIERYRVIGFAKPLRRLDGLVGFPLDWATVRFNSRSPALVGLRSPSKYVPSIARPRPEGPEPLS